MEATASEFATTGDHFIVEDLLDFSNDATADDVTATANSNSSTSSAAADDVTATAISNSSLTDLPFSTDLCVPYEDLAELEWLSNFVEESFSSEDLHKLHFISGVSALKTRPEEPTEIPYYPPDPARPAISSPTPVFNPEMPVPGKARSKRSRAAPGNWASRLLLLSSGTNPARPEPVYQPPPLPKPSKKKAGHGSGSGSGFGSGHESASGEVRRCLHCATDKTPQWRTGPLGPKTLCNACGVRYKSGRLVPEYRPAASPTFVLTKHSNSHRKVMELRRQKELQKNHLQQQQLLHDPNGMIFDPPNSDDYLIHQHIGPDFRQLI